MRCGSACVRLLALAAGLAPTAAGGVEPAHPPSAVIQGVDLDLGTLRVRAPGSDNWAITWGADGAQYTTWGDGGGFGGTNHDGRVRLGVGRVEGPKRSYSGENVWGGLDPEAPATFTGKAYGIAAIDEALYLWRTGNRSLTTAFDFQELHVSTDEGRSWSSTGVRFEPEDFPRSEGFFAPTFLQFGPGYSSARDGYVYAYAPEVKDPSSFDVQTPGEIALLRVPRGRVGTRSAYELFAGLREGEPTWTASLRDRAPVFEDAENGVMLTSVSYNAGLDRYLLVTHHVSRHRDDGGRIGIYDAPEPWGPWTTVLFADPWALGLQDGSYTVYWNFSNKWLSEDGRRFVLVYTGPGEDSWATVEGSFEVRAVPEPGAAASGGAAVLTLGLLARARRRAADRLHVAGDSLPAARARTPAAS